MTHNLLVLGGTTGATGLAHLLADHEIKATMSYAGRVAKPAAQPLAHRIGGFGGIDGLTRYLQEASITHVIDATHPFAAGMSRNAVAACARTGVPLLALTRPPWAPGPNDNWTCVADIDEAARALGQPARNVFLAVGRMHLGAFSGQPQHSYLLRLVDPPSAPVPFPRSSVEVARGPFDLESDLELMRAHGIDLVVSKNSGGSGARAKIDAARILGIEVIMIERPDLPDRTELSTPTEIVAHVLGHGETDRGV